MTNQSTPEWSFKKKKTLVYPQPRFYGTRKIRHSVHNGMHFDITPRI